MKLAAPSPRISLIRFFLLVYLLSAILWLIGFASGWAVPNFPVRLSVSSLMTFVPMCVALGLAWRESGAAGIRVLLERLLDAGGARRLGWYLLALLFMPACMVAEYGMKRLAGEAMPDPRFPPIVAVELFVLFLVAAIGEELGWQGYAYERLRARSGALASALILGVIWALWHVVPNLQIGHGAGWILWECLGIVATRVIIVWLYENAGRRLPIAVLFHAMTNVSIFLFPRYGSGYSAFATFALMAPAASIVALLWGPQTLMRFAWPGRRSY